MNRSRPTTARFLPCALALALAGCATTQGGGPGKPAGSQATTAGRAPGAERPVEDQPTISNRALLLFEEAVKAHEAGRKARTYEFAALESRYRAALDADGRLAEADYNLGVLAERQGNADRALSHYRDALRKKPSLHQAAENIAVIAQNRGDVQGAARQLEEIIARSDSASARARLAEIYRQQGQSERAMHLAREALVRDPKNLRAYKVMMRTYLGQKQLSMARLVALRAMKLDEADPELYHTVALILLEEKEITKARLQFLKALEVQPDHLPSHVELARLSMSLEDYPSAEEHLRRILQAEGGSAEVHLNLGVVYKLMGEFDKALREYDEAERLNPRLAAVYLDRAIVLHRHKDAPERAVELYRKYLSLAPEAAADPAHPANSLLKEAEQIVQAKAEATRAEEEAKKTMEQQKPDPAAGGGPKPGDGGGEPDESS